MLVKFCNLTGRKILMAPERDQNRDITLTPDTYLYMQNEGKGGIITVYRGPAVVNQTGQDLPVRYDVNNRSYKSCSLEQAVQYFQRANEGDYVVLENPEVNGRFPTETTQAAGSLKKGRKIIIPGPWSEALFPGQIATVISGHSLKTNQYLIAIIYNAEEAENNWQNTVVKPQTEDDNGEHKGRGLPKPESFAVGTRIVIKGSDVSFYIPCTGVEVLKDHENNYVREAVTLEQLEYCCLRDENGKKDYYRGPAVIFPKPTQQFETDNKGRRKFKPIELNSMNGVHLKVTASFKGPDIENDIGKQRNFEEGEELFVTGKTLSIYYPREELSIIEYGGGNRKHYSTAIPKGEGRYVINRETGEIRLITGPRMFLADPRFDIPVRRVLSPDEVNLWYPGNQDALRYNQELAEAMANSPSGRSGMVSSGDWQKHQLSKRSLAAPVNRGSVASLESSPELLDFSEEVGEEGGVTDTIKRHSTRPPQRTLTLNTKYDGVPKVEIWSGYAVLVVGAEGSRRVVQGPEVLLMQYDEKLGFMELSTSKPKSTDKLFRTSYLCTHNNQVGDIVFFESMDHVKGSIKISLRVNFEANSEVDQLKWFSVSNYVKYLCDHVRSIIAGVSKKKTVAELKADYINIVREAILGPKSESKTDTQHTSRPGLFFPANGMRVVEVEVLDLTLADAQISKLLDQAQHTVVQTNIEVEQAKKALEAKKQKEEIGRVTAEVEWETKQLKNSLALKAIEGEIELCLMQVNLELKKLEGEMTKSKQKEDIVDFTEQKRLARAKEETDYTLSIDRKKLDIKKDEIESVTKSHVDRFLAAKDGLHETLVALGRDEMAAKLAEACTIERWLSGDTHMGSIANLLSVSPALKAFFEKGNEINDKLAKNRLKSQEPIATK